MMERQYRLRLLLHGPLLTQQVGTMSFGLDAAMQRYHGVPVLGGSLVRGNLRHALRGFAERIGDTVAGRLLDADIKRWLGEPNNDGSWEPMTARVGFDMFWRPASDADPPASDGLRYRVPIDDGTGTVKERMLMAVEDVFGAAAEPVLEGRLYARFDGDDEAERFERWLRKALEFIGALGALKGIGFGRLAGAELTAITPCWRIAAEPGPVESAPHRVGLVLQPDRPFCIPLPKAPDGNVFEGDPVIPGNVLKGAMAATAALSSEDLQALYAFDALHLSHAVPASRASPTRGCPLPLSLAVVGDRVLDLALHNRPVLLGKDRQAPAFQPDWKASDWARAEAAFGGLMSRPDRFLDVRTAIQSDTDIALQGALFSHDCVDPWGMAWCADLDLGAVGDEAERARVWGNLKRLFDREIGPIGKTKARLRIQPRPSPFSAPGKPEPVKDDLFVVLLRTPARLLCSDDIDFAAINSDTRLHDLYASYWRRASGGALELSHYFAGSRRAGGGYYWRRYRGGGKPTSDYQVEWLTEPGSVFVLRAKDDGIAAAEWLHDCMQRGLPPAADREGDDWRSDPYRPEHGYGEIAVNHRDQLRLIEEPEKETSDVVE